MKRNNILKVFVSGCVLLGGLTSCEDFLTLHPTNQITEEEFWEDKGDLENGMMACYKQMTNSNLLSRVIYWGEVRSDNTAIKDMSQAYLVNYKDGVLQYTESMFSWSAFYTAINYCNKVIENVPLVGERDPSFSEGEQWQYTTEAKTLRALNYFYLVRAFRDVPLVFSSISTDAEALVSDFPQTAGLTIMDSLIADLDTIKNLGVTEYGTSSKNYGRITRNATYALLADMYLWRACMLKNAAAKGYVFNPGSKSNTEATADAQSTADLRKVIEYCDYVINAIKEKNDNNSIFNGSSSNSQTGNDQKTRYPLIWIENDFATSDEVYNDIFGNKNSQESIFEVQFDGSSNVNSAWTSIMTTTGSGIAGKLVTINDKMYASISSVAPDAGFGKGDLRALENTNLTGATAKIDYPYTKGTYTSLSVESMSDMSKGIDNTSTTTRSDGSNAHNWIVYRLSDVMLMKAEAIARLEDSNLLKEGFLLTNAIFQRSNPKVSADGSVSGENGTAGMTSDRFSDDYYSGKTAANLLTLVYNERQREFLGEFKRWFDLVRYAEANNSTEDALDLMGSGKTLKTRLRRLDSFYNPVYENELKVNTNLKQNPAWDTSVGQ